jgi:hypothetical protein
MDAMPVSTTPADHWQGYAVTLATQLYYEHDTGNAWHRARA